MGTLLFSSPVPLHLLAALPVQEQRDGLILAAGLRFGRDDEGVTVGSSVGCSEASERDGLDSLLLENVDRWRQEHERPRSRQFNGESERSGRDRRLRFAYFVGYISVYVMPFLRCQDLHRVRSTLVLFLFSVIPFTYKNMRK